MRMTSAVLGAALLCITTGCMAGTVADQGAGGGDSSSSIGSGMPLPATVQIKIVDAKIYPKPADADCWDGVCSLSQDDLNQVASALAETGDPYAVAAAVGTVLAGFANSAYGPPDPIGYAGIWTGTDYGEWVELGTVDTNFEDTFTPNWPGSPGWTDVPLEPGLSVLVHVEDEDLTSNDPIAEVYLNYDHVVAALLAQKAYPVRVDDQGSGRLLFVGIAVHGL